MDAHCDHFQGGESAGASRGADPWTPIRDPSSWRHGPTPGHERYPSGALRPVEPPFADGGYTDSEPDYTELHPAVIVKVARDLRVHSRLTRLTGITHIGAAPQGVLLMSPVVGAFETSAR